MKTKVSEIRKLVDSALVKYGYSPSESKTIGDILMYAQVRNNNQGIVKLIGKGIPRRPEGKPPIIVKETPVSALVDANKSHAMISMDYLADLAIDKAKKSGVGIAGNFDSAESTGDLGYYVNKVAQAGLIGVAFASSPFQTTAPHGSNQAKFCTNPMAYGIPTNSDPIILDMTTSAMAYYGLIEAKTANREVAEGIGYNAEGNATTSPAEIMGGALRTMAGHKGSGLALIVQVLAGAFVGADSFDSDSSNAGNLVMAIDPNIFVTTDEFKDRVSKIVSEVKSARKLPGVEEILVPGERSNRLAKQRIDTDEIEIEDNLYSELKKVSES